MAGCAQAPKPDSPASGDGQAWQPLRIPGKASTQYGWRQHAPGRMAWHAKAERSASAWMRKVHVPADRLGTAEFSWFVPALIDQASLADPDRSDSPVRVVFAFDGDHGRLSPRNRAMFELAQVLTGEPPPFATLMYVWDPQAPREQVIVSGRSDRIRKIVVESGPQHLQQWRRYERRLRDDFVKAFGEEPGPLVGVALMTDADNTASSAEAWYGDIHLR